MGSKPGVINQALLKIKIDDLVMLDKFFLYIFDWESFQKKVIDKQGGAMQNLVGMDIIRKISIPLPRLSEQYAIATVLTDMNAEIAALEARREKTLTLKQGMMQELLTGRIRLG
jgi:type I restriction enzyme, S subunit